MSASEIYLRQDTLSEISFEVGMYFGRLDADAYQRIIDLIGGRARLHDLIFEWSEEFYTTATGRVGVDDFAIEKVNVLITTLRLES